MSLQSLQDWINPALLQNPARHSRDALEHGIVLDDVFNPEQLYRVAEFMRNEAVYRELYRLIDRSHELGAPEVSREEWLAQPPARRFCFRSLVSGVKDECRESENHRAFREFWALWESPAFAAFLAKLTGEIYRVKVWAAVSHERDHFLVPHSDLKAGRMLNVVLYLSTGWRDEFGGELILFEQDSETRRIAPLFNRLVLLKPRAGSTHQVEILRPEAEAWQRFCFVIRCDDPRSLAGRKSADY